MTVQQHTASNTTPGRDATKGFMLPRRFVRTANRLLEQQFWLWGCDIRRTQGNILEQFGFTKVKDVESTGLSASRYDRAFGGAQRLSLWGFGLWLAEDQTGAIFVPRSGLPTSYSTMSVLPDECWQPSASANLAHPISAHAQVATTRLLGDVVRWIAWYERHVVDVYGAEYRQQSIDAWRKPVACAETLANKWSELALALSLRSVSQLGDQAQSDPE